MKEIGFGFRRGFESDDQGSGTGVGLEGVGTGGGLAFDGAWADGSLGIEAVGRDLFWGTHLPGIAGEGAGV